MKILEEIEGIAYKIVVFTIPIYDSKICFATWKDKESWEILMKKLIEIGVNTEKIEGDDYSICYGFVMDEPQRLKYGTTQFILINKCEEYKSRIQNTMAHENSHLIDQIVKYHGLQRYKNGDNEHIAYLTGYMFEILYELVMT